MSDTASPVWTTRDGARIAVADMSERHARNALALVTRRDGVFFRSGLPPLTVPLDAMTDRQVRERLGLYAKALPESDDGDELDWWDCR